ncbi:protein UPSTREAM OF FLC-like isoform X1 [Senna tora]|uniref:Protein UPSTREAM OF FLC-like isoform X1 n=1 Tax=Senna tora TaxID=362788 RepID=A0A834TLX0_9FABA|nr:protein UPSTREAM OF FLC-like isoform X1 [Senna tora]
MESTEIMRKKYSRQVSPERAKVWKEKSPKYHQNRKVAVIYYLSRNRQLEHPHFMEVLLSSPEGLYLRDVIDRLNALRGRGMTSLYSWSCKRSYKSGFVWHDLCEDDLILPAHGNEYVLKGSELFDQSNSDHFSPINNVKLHSLKQLPDQAATSRSQDEASSSSSMNWKDSTTRHSQEQEQELSSSSDEGKSGSANSLSLTLTEYKISNTNDGLGLADASTQTDRQEQTQKSKTCTRGVSTEEGPSPTLTSSQHVSHEVKDKSEKCRDIIVSLKTETLESLIRADSDTSSKMDSFRILKEEEEGENSSCDYMEIDCVREKNPRVLGLRLMDDDKECFSGSLVETTRLLKEHHGGGITALRRSSSCSTAERRCSEENSEEKKKECSKCIPRSIKASLTKLQLARSESMSMRSPLHDASAILLAAKAQLPSKINHTDHHQDIKIEES